MSDQQLARAVDLMMRLPPQQTETNLRDLSQLAPGLVAKGLLSSVDQPLRVARDHVEGRDYILCDRNRDRGSYRSPWSNAYDPPLDDGARPPARLRELEVAANQAFDHYREQYFQGGVSSVYLWGLARDFQGAILIKNTVDRPGGETASWDSIHAVEVQETSGNTHITLTSTVRLWVEATNSGSGTTAALAGRLTRQTEREGAVGDPVGLLANIGRLVEDMENEMRRWLRQVYFAKTRDVVGELRSVEALAGESHQEALLKRELLGALKRKQQ